MLSWIAGLALAGGPLPAPLDAVQADRNRISAHLVRVEQELRNRSVVQMPDALRWQRTQNLEWLSEYRRAGVFPRNGDFVGQRVPYFVDDAGRACAVGYLILASGNEALVESIRTSHNNAKLLDMRSEALTRWVAASGLTAQELAAIQPSYCGCDIGDWSPVCGSDGVTYGNPCFAEICAGVDVVHEGRCEGDGTTGWSPAGTGGTSSASTGTASESGSGSEDDDASASSGSTGAAGHATGTTGTPQPPSSAGPESDSSGEDPSPGGATSRSGCRFGAGASAWTLLLLGAARRRR